MSEDVMAKRVAAIAEAVRVPLDPASAERVANATRTAAKRFAEGPTPYPFETEPLTFVVVAHEDRKS